MKELHTLVILCLLILLNVSCSGSDSENEPELPNPEEPTYITGINAIVNPSGEFAKDDKATALNGTSAQKVAKLMEKTGPAIVKGIGSITITDEQYKEIETFTNELVKNLKEPKEKYEKIFKWITSTIKYASGYVDNDPYPVFQTHQAICQGYANLLTVMLHSQDIPCFNTNGMLNPIGGHAWNYVYLDEWYVSDPTNNGHFRMNDIDSYKHLDPMSLDVDIFEDDNYIYNFYERRLNLRQVKKSGKQLTVPFSTNGFQVSSFNPDTELPANVEEIYIGKNIETLGENIVGLNKFAPSVKYAYVETSNTKLESYGQVVYQNSQPYYVPAAATIIQFKPTATLEKNFLHHHDKVETIVIQSGTKKIEAYAFENCPNLRKAYIPEETVTDSKAFYDVHSSFQIIRGIVKD